MEPASSKGKSPWKVKKVRGSRAGGIVIPKGAILVNQGLRKVKLEEDFVGLKPEVPVEIEQGENSRTTSTELLSEAEAITEEYAVAKVEVDIPNVPMSSKETPAKPAEEDAQSQGGSSFFPEEIESLKCTVKQLSVQIEKLYDVNKRHDKSIKEQEETIKKQNEATKKQNEAIKKQNDVISGMKSLLRNIGLSITTYLNDFEEQEKGGCHGNSEDFFQGENFRFTAENSLSLERLSGGPRAQHGVIQDYSKYEEHRKPMIPNKNGTGDGTDTEIPADVSSHQASPFMESSSISEPLSPAGQSTENYNMNVDGADVEEDNEDRSGTPKTSSNEADLMTGQNAKDQEDSILDNDNEDDADVQDNDDDNNSSYVPDDFAGESNNGLEDTHNRPEIQLKSTELSTKTIKGSFRSAAKSTVNSERSFRCPRCGKNYINKESLTVHMHDNHSEKSQKKFKCHLCPRVFNYQSGVKHHVSTFHEHVRYKCAHCPGTFTMISHVARHAKLVHSKGGPPTQECKICGIHLVNSVMSLKVHMNNMHNESRAKPLPKEGNPKKKKRIAMRRTKVFKCQLCPSSFPERKDLSCHLSQSHGITDKADG